MRCPVLAVGIATLAEHLREVREPLTRRFLVVDQPNLSAPQALRQPDHSSAVLDRLFRLAVRVMPEHTFDRRRDLPLAEIPGAAAGIPGHETSRAAAAFASAVTVLGVPFLRPGLPPRFNPFVFLAETSRILFPCLQP